jgi:hypothetical protein
VLVAELYGDIVDAAWAALVRPPAAADRQMNRDIARCASASTI